MELTGVMNYYGTYAGALHVNLFVLKQDSLKCSHFNEIPLYVTFQQSCYHYELNICTCKYYPQITG